MWKCHNEIHYGIQLICAKMVLKELMKDILKREEKWTHKEGTDASRNEHRN